MSDIREFCPLWGEWEIEGDMLGKGSFGTVWKIRRKVTATVFYYAAVKHISIPSDDEEIHRLREEGFFSSEESVKSYYHRMLQSMMDEINTMHALEGYTNIVSYQDHQVIPRPDEIGYDIFLRMEYLTPLSTKIPTMTVADIVKLGIDISTALCILNSHGLIHRDIKPQNILFNATGDYKLGDYGTARALKSEATAMSRKGTYNYMSPEIYNGKPADIRADIYSLGLVLYKLLNGNRHPFLDQEREITSEMSEKSLVQRMSGKELPPPRFADERLSQLILRACAFHPEERYQNPRALKKALEQYKPSEEKISYESQQDKTVEDSHIYTFNSSSSGSQNNPPQIPANKSDEAESSASGIQASLNPEDKTVVDDERIDSSAFREKPVPEPAPKRHTPEEPKPPENKQTPSPSEFDAFETRPDIPPVRKKRTFSFNPFGIFTVLFERLRKNRGSRPNSKEAEKRPTDSRDDDSFCVSGFLHSKSKSKQEYDQFGAGDFDVPSDSFGVYSDFDDPFGIPNTPVKKSKWKWTSRRKEADYQDASSGSDFDDPFGIPDTPSKGSKQNHW